jgi:hypothetical protein
VSKYIVISPCYAEDWPSYDFDLTLKTGEQLEFYGGDSSGNVFVRSNGQQVIVSHENDNKIQMTGRGREAVPAVPPCPNCGNPHSSPDNECRYPVKPVPVKEQLKASLKRGAKDAVEAVKVPTSESNHPPQAKDAYNSPERIEQRFQDLRVQSTPTLKDRVKQLHKIVDVRGADKRLLIDMILEAEYGERTLAAWRESRGARDAVLPVAVNDAGKLVIKQGRSGNWAVFEVGDDIPISDWFVSKAKAEAELRRRGGLPAKKQNTEQTAREKMRSSEMNPVVRKYFRLYE